MPQRIVSSLGAANKTDRPGPCNPRQLTPQNSVPNHEIFLGEEEISDVSLSTFYVFDKENAAQPQLGEKVAWGCGCRRGCGCGWRRCGGCGCGGGCGGCCWSWGRCRWC